MGAKQIIWRHLLTTGSDFFIWNRNVGKIFIQTVLSRSKLFSIITLPAVKSRCSLKIVLITYVVTFLELDVLLDRQEYTRCENQSYSMMIQPMTNLPSVINRYQWIKLISCRDAKYYFHYSDHVHKSNVVALILMNHLLLKKLGFNYYWPLTYVSC